jgi:hypothetical protein
MRTLCDLHHTGFAQTSLLSACCEGSCDEYARSTERRET